MHMPLKPNAHAVQFRGAPKLNGMRLKIFLFHIIPKIGRSFLSLPVMAT